MKEFNLEEAKKGKAICMKNGKPARIISFDRKSKDYPIIALVDLGSYEDILTYTKDGHLKSFCKDSYDLMMAPEKKEGWMPIYKGEKGYYGGYIKETQEEAMSSDLYGAKCIDTVHVIWKE